MRPRPSRQRSGEKPDVCLLDLRTPGGLLATVLGDQGPAPRREIVYDGFDDDADLFAALRSGVDGNLLKTTNLKRLPRDALDGVCAARRPYRERSSKTLSSALPPTGAAAAETRRRRARAAANEPRRGSSRLLAQRLIHRRDRSAARRRARCGCTSLRSYASPEVPEGPPQNCSADVQTPERAHGPRQTLADVTLRKDSADTPLRALIADDHALIRRSFRADLEAAAIEVCAEVANKVLRRSAPHLPERPDICLLDVRMPEGDGIDRLAESIGGRCPRETVLITGLPRGRRRSGSPRAPERTARPGQRHRPAALGRISSALVGAGETDGYPRRLLYPAPHASATCYSKTQRPAGIALAHT